MKLPVVPDSSERWTGVMSELGRLASGFSEAIAESSHEVMSPAKMLAIVSGVSCRSSTPGRL